MVVSHSDPPFTVTTLADGAVAGDICTSPHVPLSGIGAGHEPATVAVILYAGMPGTFVDLAADLAWLTGRPPTDFMLDIAEPLPHSMPTHGLSGKSFFSPGGATVSSPGRQPWVPATAPEEA